MSANSKVSHVRFAFRNGTFLSLLEGSHVDFFMVDSATHPEVIISLLLSNNKNDRMHQRGLSMVGRRDHSFLLGCH